MLKLKIVNLIFQFIFDSEFMEMKLLKIINMNINLSDEKLNKNPMKGICQIKVI